MSEVQTIIPLDADTLGGKTREEFEQEFDSLKEKNEELVNSSNNFYDTVDVIIAPKDCTNISVINGNGKVTISWTDPEDSIIDDIVFNLWGGTKLVMKEGSYPVNDEDGILLLDSKQRNEYKTNGYEVNNLENGVTYYFQLFPYSTKGFVNKDVANRCQGNPFLVFLDNCTGISLTKTLTSVTVKWTDPDATKNVNGNIATWKKTVLVYKEGSYPTDISDGTVAVEETTRNSYETDGYTVDGLVAGKTYYFKLFPVSTDNAITNSNDNVVEARLSAKVVLTTEETTLYGQTVTLSKGDEILTCELSSSGSAIVYVTWTGEVNVSATDGTDTIENTITISNNLADVTYELCFLKIVTFADGTYEEISAMLDAHYAGKINIADYWSVGDTRVVNISAMGDDTINGSGNWLNNTHEAQNIELVIVDFNIDDLKTSIGDSNKAAVSLHMKGCLQIHSGMNCSEGRVDNGDSNTEFYPYWDNCERRKWCNTTFKQALPSQLRDMIKTVVKRTYSSEYKQKAITTEDDCYMLSNYEVYGKQYNSNVATNLDGYQYEYYKVEANRNKETIPVNNSNSKYNNIWWLRTSRIGYVSSSDVRFYYICVKYSNSNSYSMWMIERLGLSIGFCI